MVPFYMQQSVTQSLSQCPGCRICSTAHQDHADVPDLKAVVEITWNFKIVVRKQLEDPIGEFLHR